MHSGNQRPRTENKRIALSIRVKAKKAEQKTAKSLVFRRRWNLPCDSFVLLFLASVSWDDSCTSRVVCFFWNASCNAFVFIVLAAFLGNASCNSIVFLVQGCVSLRCFVQFANVFCGPGLYLLEGLRAIFQASTFSNVPVQFVLLWRHGRCVFGMPCAIRYIFGPWPRFPEQGCEIRVFFGCWLVCVEECFVQLR